MPVVASGFGPSGPLIELYVGVSAPRARALATGGHHQPPAIKLAFIIDTGASTTLIDEQYMRALGIPGRGRRNIVTSSTEGGVLTVCETYDVSIELRRAGHDGEVPFRLGALEVFGRPLHPGSIDGMLGRDVLEHCTFVLDGPNRTFRMLW